MQRMLHITGKMDRAGAETMIMNLYRNIDREKFQFDFVSFSDEEGDFDKEIKEHGGVIYHITESNPIRRMFKLRDLLKQHPEYRIIHCHTLFSNAFHLLAGKMVNVSYSIAHSHSTSVQSKGYLMSTLYHTFSRIIMRKYATHYIGCGKAAAKFLFPFNDKVLFLPNAIDTIYYSKEGEDKKRYLQDLFKLDDECLKIIQVGRIETVKNHKFSLKIAEELKSMSIQFKMIFVGQGSLYNEIENEIKEKELTEHVLLLGVRSDIPQLMAGSDVMIMPSLHEGFPVVLVESQSVGIPSLIADTISSEVDLNVGLVEFESLDSNISNWTNKLINLKNKKRMVVKQRLSKISEQGFDIKSSAIILSDLYSSMK